MNKYNTLQIKQFRYSRDNLSYLVYGEKEALAIDGGAVTEILNFTSDNNLELSYVANTHSHHDHTPGNKTLLAKTGANYLSNEELIRAKKLAVEDEIIKVYHTPGHSADSVCFHFENVLVAGDTLFNGTVGNCFSGDMKGFFNSIKFLTSLPPETVIYAGHDYIEESMMVARHIEPDNSNIDEFMGKYDRGHVYSTLEDELLVNPYLRHNEKNIVDLLVSKGLPVATEYERWASLMSIE